MLPIPSGKFKIGSSDKDANRKPDEGPQREVTISPFWMGKCEVTNDEYDLFLSSLDCALRRDSKITPTPEDLKADAMCAANESVHGHDLWNGSARFSSD